jgi:hypothetical protein
MIVKKTNFSNLIWVLYSVMALAFGAVVFSNIAGSFYLDAGFGLLFVLALFVLCVAFEIIGTRERKDDEVVKASPMVLLTEKQPSRVFNTVCYLLFGLSVILGSFLRLRNIFFYGFENSDGSRLILGTVICILLSVAMFFGIKKSIGNIPAVFASVFIMISPYISNEDLLGGEEVISLVLMVLTYLFINEIFPSEDVKVPQSLFAGLFMGASIATDKSGAAFLLVLPMFFIPGREIKAGNSKYEIKESYQISFRIVNMFIWIFSGLVGFAATVFLYSMIAKVGYLDMVTTTVQNFGIMETRISVTRNIDLVSGGIIGAFLILGIPAGFLQKYKDPGVCTLLILLGNAILNMLGFSHIQYGKGIFAFILLAALAGASIENLLFRTEPTVIPEQEEPEQEELIQEEPEQEELTQEEPEQGKIQDTNESENINKPVDLGVITGFTVPLENPLPIPERKERKALDYDYEVPDDADYDI